MIMNVLKKCINRFGFYKAACEIGVHKLAFADKTMHFGGNWGKQFALIFYSLQPSHMNALDACKVSNVWVE